MGGARRALTYLAVFVPFLLSASSVFSISMVLSQLSATFRASLGEVLLAIPLDFIGGALGGLLIGGLADRAGRRPALMVSSALFGLGVLASSIINNVYELWALWLVVGFGVNAQNGVSYAVIVELTRGMRGSVGGAVQGLYFLGLFVDSLIYNYIRYWRLYLASVGIISLALSIPLTYAMEETYRGGGGPGRGLIPRGSAALTALFAAYAVGAFMFSVPLSSVAPEVALLFHAQPSFVMLLSILGFASFVTAGLASDRADRALVTVSFAALGAAGSLLALTLGAPMAVLPMLYLASGFFSYAGVWISESYQPEERATASNFVFLFGRLVGGFSPELVYLLSFSGLYEGLAINSLISSIVTIATATLIYRRFWNA